MSGEEHVTDLLAGYALGILEDDEARQVREHLLLCNACQVELRSFQKVVDELPLAAVESTPPPMLREKIMQQARETKPASQSQNGQTWWQSLKGSLAWRTPAWGMVSLALIVLLGISNIFLWQRLTRVQNDHPSALATVPLKGSQVVPGATGMLVISSDGEHGTLVVDGLPPLDASQQYQLWLIQDGQRTSGGIFSVDAEGYGSLWITSPKPLISYQAVGITVEPAGGSPAPTGERVLGGEL